MAIQTDAEFYQLQEEIIAEPLTPGQIIRLRFLRHKMAVFGAIMLIVLLLLSLIHI